LKEFTDQERIGIIDDANAGATIQDLGDLYNCTEEDIEGLCKRDPEVGQAVRSARAKIRMFIRKRLMEVSLNEFDQRSAYCALGQLAKSYLRDNERPKRGRKKGEEVDLDELSDEEVEKLLAESDSKFAEYVGKQKDK